MVHQITDTQRQVAVNMPWKRLLIFFAIVCTIAGLLVGGYFALINNAEPTATTQPPPVQPNPLPPVVATTPTQPAATTPASTAPQKLEVKWETGGPLKPRLSAFGISGLLIQNSEVVYALGPIGPNQNKIWKTEDGGKIWNETKENPFPGDPSSMEGWERELCDKLDNVFESQVIPSINLGIIPMGLGRAAVDQNNSNNLLASVVVFEVPPYPPEMPDSRLKEQNQKQREIAQTQKLNTQRIFISLDGGKSWKEINHPPGRQTPMPSISLALISSQNYVRIYVGLTDGTVWQVNLDVNSLTSR